MNQTTLNNIGLLLGRLGLGVVMLYFGCQKALGIFGGMGITDTIQMFHDKMHIPPALAVCAICGEFLGALGLIFGCLHRIAAFGVMCTMAVAAYTTLSGAGFGNALVSGDIQTVSHGFFPLVMAFFALTLMLLGAGDYAIDRKLFGKRKRAKTA